MKYMTSKITTKKEQPQKTNSLLAYLSLCVVWIGVVGLTMASDTGLRTSKIRLSAAQLHMIDIVAALPGLLIVLSILFAAISIGHYARAIAGSKEGAGFRFVAYGIFALLVGLLAGSYLGALQQLLSQHARDPQKVKTTFVIISNYVSVVSALVTYGLLLQGGRLLLRAIGQRLDVAKKLLPLVLGFVGLTAVYLWLIHANPASQTSVDPGIEPTFGLPYWLTVLTVALPFVVSWFVGVLALMGIYQYRQKTTGVVYKLLFRKLFVGLALFIGLTISLQLFTQLYGLYAESSLSVILSLNAVVYLILTYAFVLIAQGARKLNAIETLPVE